MAKEKFETTDFVSHADADDELGEDADLGSKLPEDEEEEEEKKPEKKPEKKEKPAVDEEDEEEADDSEEEEEDEEAAKEETERSKLAKKLARTSIAREKLEKQVDELRSQLNAQTRDQSDTARAKVDKLKEELETLYGTVEELRAEGKTTEAGKAQRRIDEIRDGMTRSQAAAIALTEAIAQSETRAFNQMVRELEVIDPRFDKDSDDFDQDLLDSVGELVEGYEGRGMATTDALRKACKLVLREDVFSKARPLTRKPPEKPPARKTDVKKNTDTARKTPPDNPNQRREKADADIDMETISEKDFDALPESTLRRLLGEDGS